jgi:hypothetical protein
LLLVSGLVTLGFNQWWERGSYQGSTRWAQRVTRCCWDILLYRKYWFNTSLLHVLIFIKSKLKLSPSKLRWGTAVKRKIN